MRKLGKVGRKLRNLIVSEIDCFEILEKSEMVPGGLQNVFGEIQLLDAIAFRVFEIDGGREQILVGPFFGGEIQG